MSFLNLANKLTILRMLLIPVFLVLIEVKIPFGVYLATLIFILASITDKLDGYIARSRNQVTNLGKFLDPLADKLLIVTALVSLVEMGKLPAWMVMIIIAREFAITGLRAIAASQGIIIAASRWGKLKTTLQIVAIIAALISIPYYGILIWVAVFITIISGVDYIYKNRAVFTAENN